MWDECRSVEEWRADQLSARNEVCETIECVEHSGGRTTYPNVMSFIVMVSTNSHQFDQTHESMAIINDQYAQISTLRC